MKYKNIDSWKNEMKRISLEKQLDIQDVQLRYVMEEFAIKISKSNYSNMLVIKGGFVVSTLLGLDTRMTRDIDMTCRSKVFTKEEITDILMGIVNVETNSFFEYKLLSVVATKKDDISSGFIVKINAVRDKTTMLFKVDISNNSLIYPEAIMKSIKSLFTNQNIRLATYSIENIIAEKFETTLDRGEFNTRMRDLCDIYLLIKNNNELDRKLLSKSIYEISKDRETLDNLEDYDTIVDSLKSSEIFTENFDKYIKIEYPNVSIRLEMIFEEFDNIKNNYDLYCNK